ESIIVVYLAAKLALNNTLTVGMIFAFMSYKRHFTDKTVLLIEKALEFRLLDLHLERLADIALTPLERGQDQPLAYTRPIQGRIELRNVCFRYAEAEPYVLENVNLTVEPGQFVTIMGPSGGGKTTLMKIMLGLFEPTSGEVLIDGTPLSAIGHRAYREQVAAVMQEDQPRISQMAALGTDHRRQLDERAAAACQGLLRDQSTSCARMALEALDACRPGLLVITNVVSAARPSR
ncbi:MAG: ATP-binding cassette domain-containing protein, partial [Chloroflexota bacterium]|nr:ATP-binding cassette domain-containing protein [Chloroflexota bacterium]